MKIDYVKKIEQCITYIEDNLTQKVYIDDVLENTYYSYPHFHRIFMDIVGEPMTTYIRKRKLSCAAEKLINTKKSIVDIAFDYNFSSQQTFNRAFTGCFGISPLKYRNIGMLDDLYKPFAFTDCFFDDLIPISVSIERLQPMTVASYHSYSDNIILKNTRKEQDVLISKAWGNLIRWQMSYEYQKKFGIVKKLPATSMLGKFMIDNNLHLPPYTRYFGFTNPFPTSDSEFGYEVWAELTNMNDSVKEETQSGDIIIKNVEGGLYVTAEATYGPDSNLDQVWKALHYWLMQNQQYNYGDHQWLEEHITKSGEGGFHSFKLYLPIQPIGD
jgi:AraC family transcriptional regulator